MRSTSATAKLVPDGLAVAMFDLLQRTLSTDNLVHPRVRLCGRVDRQNDRRHLPGSAKGRRYGLPPFRLDRWGRSPILPKRDWDAYGRCPPGHNRAIEEDPPATSDSVFRRVLVLLRQRRLTRSDRSSHPPRVD